MTNVSETYGELSLRLVTDFINFLHYTFDENSTLLDIGSGSGKVLLCAQALLPFPLKKVYGTEFVPHRNDFAKKLLREHENYFPKNDFDITFNNTMFEEDDIIHESSWTHVIAFDTAFSPETKEKIVEFLKNQRQKNDIYFVSATALKHGHHNWNSIDAEFTNEMQLLRNFARAGDAIHKQSVTLQIYKIRKK